MLEIKNCNYSYDNQAQTLNNINLKIEPGMFFGLLGENGAGKTTLIQLIVSLLNLQQGEILINNKTLQKSPTNYKKQIGWVPQEFNFNAFQSVEMSLINSAGYYGINPKKAKSRIQFLLESLNLWSRRKMRIRQLSGGLKRRLMIARALLHEPKILLLDEPTAGIDITMRKNTWEFLEYLNNKEKTTIILTSHYLEEIEKLCNQVAVLHNGRIIKCGNLQTMLKDHAQETTFLQLKNKIPNNLQIINLENHDLKNNILAIAIKDNNQLNDTIKLLNSHDVSIARIWSEQTKLATLLNQWTSA